MSVDLSQFVEVKPNESRRWGLPTISYYRNGVGVLSKAARAALGNPEAVSVSVNKDAKQLLVRPAELRHGESYPLNKTTHAFTARAIMEGFGVQPNAQFAADPITLNGDGPALLIDLSKPLPKSRSGT